MRSIDSLCYLKAQFKKMLTDKWDEGLKIRSDPGETYILQWIEHNAEKFRKKWENCQCRTCSNVLDCGFKEATDCTYHIIEHTSSSD